MISLLRPPRRGYRAAGGGGIGWLVPGLVLAGAGMGLTITPLTTTVLAYASPERAGAVSVVLSTVFHTAQPA